ncbi:hypothetical protein R50073_24360 [Maricurvus nonylphenolicus]|uniref:ogr/Delta-like zinc finger family protein n=1 Tax=Maricurvus nonylphenolicus TaxID=1008307 RepID=UPI0036F44238
MAERICQPITVCPHCLSNSKAVKTNQVTRMYREAVYRCNNIECGAVFKVAMTPISMISPSAIPHEEVVLPVSKQSNSAQKQLDFTTEGETA